MLHGMEKCKYCGAKCRFLGNICQECLQRDSSDADSGDDPNEAAESAKEDRRRNIYDSQPSGPKPMRKKPTRAQEAALQRHLAQQGDHDRSVESPSPFWKRLILTVVWTGICVLAIVLVVPAVFESFGPAIGFAAPLALVIAGLAAIGGFVAWLNGLVPIWSPNEAVFWRRWRWFHSQ